MIGPATLPAPAAASGLLARLGLGRPELRAWAMYDWAVSSLQTTVMVAIFPIYFVKVAGAGGPPAAATQALATANTVAQVTGEPSLANFLMKRVEPDCGESARPCQLYRVLSKMRG